MAKKGSICVGWKPLKTSQRAFYATYRFRNPKIPLNGFLQFYTETAFHFVAFSHNRCSAVVSRCSLVCNTRRINSSQLTLSHTILLIHFSLGPFFTWPFFTQPFFTRSLFHSALFSSAPFHSVHVHATFSLLVCNTRSTSPISFYLGHF